MAVEPKSEIKPAKDGSLKKDKKRSRIAEDSSDAYGQETTSKCKETRQNLGDELIKKIKVENDPIKANDALNVSVSGNNCDFKPISVFTEAKFAKGLLKACENFEKPSPIQAYCWPIILAKRDVIGIAETGSGKTLGFGLPIAHHVIESKKFSSPRILVLSPTRELALQSHQVFEQVGKDLGLKSVCIYGGVSKGDQRKLLKDKICFIVATPGRLLDLLQEQTVDLNGIVHLVLDEADRMLDLGFEKDIRAIIGAIPKRRQTLMFSATWPQSIQKLADEFLNDPIKVTIGSIDLSASQNVKQVVEVIDEPRDRDSRLHQLLQQYHKSRTNRILIFVLYKKEADRVELYLRSKGWKVQSIHGDKNQHLRTEAINRFKDGSEPLLVATDVAARGLDIPNVEYVLNFSFPLTIEDYIHRIGRTGRGGKQGISHTLFTPLDKAHSGELINVLKAANHPIPQELLKFGTTVKKKEHKDYGAFYKEIDPNVKASHVKFDD